MMVISLLNNNKNVSLILSFTCPFQLPFIYLFVCLFVPISAPLWKLPTWRENAHAIFWKEREHIKEVFASLKEQQLISSSAAGVIQWRTVNPGSQVVGSFNPIIADPEDWYTKEYYLSPSDNSNVNAIANSNKRPSDDDDDDANNNNSSILKKKNKLQ